MNVSINIRLHSSEYSTKTPPTCFPRDPFHLAPSKLDKGLLEGTDFLICIILKLKPQKPENTNTTIYCCAGVFWWSTCCFIWRLLLRRHGKSCLVKFKCHSLITGKNFYRGESHLLANSQAAGVSAIVTIARVGYKLSNYTRDPHPPCVPYYLNVPWIYCPATPSTLALRSRFVRWSHGLFNVL